jgi:hypothetical protein
MKYCGCLWIVMVMLASAGASAQEDGISGITGKGVKIGAAFSSYGTDTSLSGLEGRSTLTWGAFLTYSINSQLAIQPELCFVEKGVGEDDLFWDSGFHLTYLEIPVLLKYRLGSDAGATPWLYAGPAFGILLDAVLYSDGSFSEWETYNHFSTDVKDDLKGLDLALVLGGELEFGAFGATRAVLDLRYSLGLTNQFDVDGWNAERRILYEGDGLFGPYVDYDRPELDGDAYIKNQAFTIRVGFKR